MKESQHVEKDVHAVSLVYARTAGISFSHQRDPFRITDATAEGRCFPTTNYARAFAAFDARRRRVCV